MMSNERKLYGGFQSRTARTAAIGSFVVMLIGGVIGSEPPQPPQGVTSSESETRAETKVDEAAKHKAVAAKEALFTRLSSRLTEVISQDGPAAAIDVCSREASVIASEVGKEHGVSIGRTSFRLRNPKNAPPKWAQSFVEQRVSEPQFVSLSNGDAGALLPIRLKQKCLTCHGPSENIAADVVARLNEFYPDDQATGFNEGDLRGWFWIEVPAEFDGSGDVHNGEKAAVTETGETAEKAAVQHGPGQGRGRGLGRGMRRGMGRGPGMTAAGRGDMTTLHAMFADRDKINRTVKMLPNGAEAITESDDEEIAALLKQHVPAMENRVHENDPLPPMTFHPIFVHLIKHADDYTLTYKDTEKGVKVTYEADDPFVIMLVQEHARLVSRFIKNGMEEIHKPYVLPAGQPPAISPPDEQPLSDHPQYIHPAIADYGKVVKLPTAAHQPRHGSRIVVDITQGGEPSRLNPAIEKVCRFVNIYAGAGKQRASVDIAVVLHGDATLAVLNADAYAERFQTNGNPNLACLIELKKAGVDVFVCGQSLIGKGAKPSQVSDQAKVAVSALTSLVNLQAEGYAYLPMLK